MYLIDTIQIECGKMLFKNLLNQMSATCMYYESRSVVVSMYMYIELHVKCRDRIIIV